jgi:hypothetical protein
VFDRAAIEAVGLFDERLIRNQDYELNIRLRKAGGDVVFDPELSVGYTPRGSWSALAKQYYEYGQWKAVVLRMHPESLKLRQLIPPIGVLGVLLSIVLGLGARTIAAPRWVPWAAAFAPLAYVVALVHAARSAPNPLRSIGALAVIHGAWTAGLLSRSATATDGVLRPVPH